MTFRKDSLLFYQGQIICVVMMAMCLSLIFMFGIVVAFLCELPFVALIMMFPKLYNEYITINEKGISCYTAKSQIWAYEWDDIAELKSSSRFRLPSMEVIPKNFRFHVPANHYFQLSRTAKEALEKYYGPTEISM